MADHRSALVDILDAIEGLRDALRDVTVEQYEANRLLRWSCERGIEIISEASRRIPKEFKAAHAELPWREIAGIGNILRHEYQRVAPRIVWNVIRRDLEPLESLCREELARLDAEAP